MSIKVIDMRDKTTLFELVYIPRRDEFIVHEDEELIVRDIVYRKSLFGNTDVLVFVDSCARDMSWTHKY